MTKTEYGRCGFSVVGREEQNVILEGKIIPNRGHLLIHGINARN
jgi:hypothetical protein